MRHAHRWLGLVALFLIATGQAPGGCSADESRDAAGDAPAESAGAPETAGPAEPAPAPAQAASGGGAGPAPGKYGCTASRYSAASGMIEYEMKGSIVLAADGTYRYLGFEQPSPGRYRTDPASGKVAFQGGHLDGGEATPVEDRPGKYFVVAPGIAENRWTCGLADEG